MLDLLDMYELPVDTTARLSSDVHRKVELLVSLFLVRIILLESGFVYSCFSTKYTRVSTIIYWAIIARCIANRFPRTNLPIPSSERENLSKDPLDFIWFVMTVIPLAEGMLATDSMISIIYWIFPPSGNPM